MTHVGSTRRDAPELLGEVGVSSRGGEECKRAYKPQYSLTRNAIGTRLIGKNDYELDGLEKVYNSLLEDNTFFDIAVFAEMNNCKADLMLEYTYKKEGLPSRILGAFIAPGDRCDGIYYQNPMIILHNHVVYHPNDLSKYEHDNGLWYWFNPMINNTALNLLGHEDGHFEDWLNGFPYSETNSMKRENDVLRRLGLPSNDYYNGKRIHP